MDLTIIEQKPVAISEIREKLDNAKTLGELSFRAKKVETYVNDLGLPKKEKIDEIHKKITELNISRLRDRHITKVLDIMPTDMETLKSLFTGEAVSIKQDELKQILDVITEN